VLVREFHERGEEPTSDPKACSDPFSIIWGLQQIQAVGV
jgi:hypothetical protein